MAWIDRAPNVSFFGVPIYILSPTALLLLFAYSHAIGVDLFFLAHMVSTEMALLLASRSDGWLIHTYFAFYACGGASGVISQS